MKVKHAILLSGGVDSMVVLASLLAVYPDPEQVTAFSIKYPSKHNALEREASRRISAFYFVNHKELDLTGIFAAFDSALLTSSDRPIPEGHYESETMKDTVVPLRNFIFSTIIAGILASQNSEDETTYCLWTGVHAGDHAIYPDCRPKATGFLAKMLSEGTEDKVRLITPLINVDKAEIVKIGLKYNVPFRLARTCYTDNPIACGRCGSCNERLAAFAANGVLDPIPYQL